MVFILMVIREPALAILVSCLFVSTPSQSIWILFYRDDHNHFCEFIEAHVVALVLMNVLFCIVSYLL